MVEDTMLLFHRGRDIWERLLIFFIIIFLFVDVSLKFARALFLCAFEGSTTNLFGHRWRSQFKGRLLLS